MAEMKNGGPTGKGPENVGKKKEIRFTFGKKIDPKTEGKLGRPELQMQIDFMEAVSNNDTARAKELMEKGVYPNLVD
ncbi:MAG: hypothetical protein V1492_03205, partial [Candidatus Micrarchaeota archaeon]